MRSKKALINAIFAIIMEMFTVLSGIIVPRLIIGQFGSEINGLLSSITQFLAYLKLLESGVGGVVKAALYKPLSDNDTDKISSVIKAAERFFRKIATVSIVYIAILAIIFPLLVTKSYTLGFTASLVIIIGIGSIAQYYFGITYQLLISADQKRYIYCGIQIVSTILNILIVLCTVKQGCSIQVVKLVSAIVFVGRPLLLNIYVSKKYRINKKAVSDDMALAQRWNGVGFSVASFIHKKTDVFLITLMLSLSEVSVYSVYATIATGLDSVVSMTTNSFQAAFGNMIAKHEEHVLNQNFRINNLIVHVLVFTLFPIALVLMNSYVGLYVSGVDDANYIRPLFGIILIIGEMIYCLRQPYQAVVTAAGHYKQTQRGAFCEAGLNIIVSVLLMFRLGIVGAAIGTLISMVYRTLDYVIYLSKNIINFKISFFVYRILVSAVAAVLGMWVCYLLDLHLANTWAQWILNGCLSMIIILGINIVANFIFYRNDMLNFTTTLFRALGLSKITGGEQKNV